MPPTVCTANFFWNLYERRCGAQHLSQGYFDVVLIYWLNSFNGSGHGGFAPELYHISSTRYWPAGSPNVLCQRVILII